MPPDPTHREIARDLRRTGRLLGRRGIFVADDGNMSARCPDGTIWITTRGTRKDALREGDIVRISADGSRVEGTGEPSSESFLHLGIYSWRPDVGAVIHAHPPFATGFAAAGVEIREDALAEAAAVLGRVPVVPYRTPGGREAGDIVRPYLALHRALLLSNHGAVTLGRDLEEACRRMERLEHVARTVLTARLLGGVCPLTREQREALGKQ
jgi:L-fuculose-phosphate aldolase